MSSHPPTHRPAHGRRPSVSPTTARRSRSARRRPGAGPLPSWRPAARVLKRSSPRCHFRVYGEEEFFAAIERSAIERSGDGAPARGHSSRRRDRAPRRDPRPALVGIAVLGAASALAALILASVSGPTGQGARRAVLRAARPDRGRVSREPASRVAREASPWRARPRERRAPKIGKRAAHMHPVEALGARHPSRSSRQAPHEVISVPARAYEADAAGVGSNGPDRRVEFGFER